MWASWAGIFRQTASGVAAGVREVADLLATRLSHSLGDDNSDSHRGHEADRMPAADAPRLLGLLPLSPAVAEPMRTTAGDASNTLPLHRMLQSTPSPSATRSAYPSLPLPGGTRSPSATRSAYPSLPLPGNGSAPVPVPVPTPRRNSSAADNATTTDSTTYVVTEEVQIRNGPLETLWKIVYWITFLLTYIIIAVVQEYINAGDFTRCGRLRTSLTVNIVFYGICGVLGAGALAYVMLYYGLNVGELAATLISLANTYGLVLVVLLMGYGAAEVPKGIWRRSNPARELRRVRFKAPELHETLLDAQATVSELIQKVREFDREVAAMGQASEFREGGAQRKQWLELRRCCDIVMSKVARELAEGGGGARGRVVDAEAAAKAEAALKKKAAKGNWSKAKLLKSQLAYLHKRVMVAKRVAARFAYKWRRHVMYAVQLEHVASGTVPPEFPASAAGQRAYWDGAGSSVSDRAHAEEADLKAAAAGPSSSVLAALCCLPRATATAVHVTYWQYRITLAPYTDKLLALAAEALSALLMWSEATIWINLSGLATNNLSVFGQLLRAVAQDGNQGYFMIQVVAAIPLAWMCICSTYAVFKFRFFNLLDLSPHRNTDPYAMCINAALFNRLQFSLAFNYLNVLMHSGSASVAANGDYPDTAFMHSVGVGMKLAVVDWYLPILMPVVYLLCRLDCFDRLMRLLGINERGDPVRGNEEHEEIITDGTKTIAAARRAFGFDALEAGGLGGGTGRVGAGAGRGGAGAGAGAGDIELPVAPSYAGDLGPGRKGMMSLDAFSAAGASRTSTPSSTGSGNGNGSLLGGASGAAAPSFFGAVTNLGAGIGAGIGAGMAAVGLGGLGFGGAGGAGGGGGPGGTGGRGGKGGLLAEDGSTDTEAYMANPWGVDVASVLPAAPAHAHAHASASAHIAAPSSFVSAPAPGLAPPTAAAVAPSAFVASFRPVGAGDAGAGSSSLLGSARKAGAGSGSGGPTSLAAFAAVQDPASPQSGKSLASLLKGKGSRF